MYEYEHELPFEKDLVNLLVKEKGWVDDHRGKSIPVPCR